MLLLVAPGKFDNSTGKLKTSRYYKILSSPYYCISQGLLGSFGDSYTTRDKIVPDKLCKTSKLCKISKPCKIYTLAQLLNFHNKKWSNGLSKKKVFF